MITWSALITSHAFVRWAAFGAGFCLRDLRFQPGKSRDREGGGRRGARQRLECVRYGGDEGCLRIFFIFFLEWGQSTNTKAPISEVGW